MSVKGYKVVVKGELKGPFKESSILNGIRSGLLPLNAELIELDTGKRIRARDLVSDEDLDYDNTIPLFEGDF